jgi:tetratricopeptide (TPR) repeat protein
MKVVRFLVVAFYVIAHTLNVSAQPLLPDSLVQRLNTAVQDSAFIDQLNVWAYEYLKSRPDISRQISLLSQEKAQSINYTRGYARALSNIGSSYWSEGIYEIAQNYYLAAARQYQSINDSVGLGKMYNNIGEVYKKLELYSKALEYQLLSYELIKNSVGTRPLALYNIGETYLGMKQLEDATDYMNQALELAKQDGDKKVTAYCYWSIGNINSRNGKYNEALGYYTLSEKLWKELGEKRSAVQNYQDFANAYKSLGEYDKATTYLTEASQLAEEIHAQDLIARNYLYRFKLDSVRKDFSGALKNLYRYNTLKDSLSTSNKTEQINRMQTIYETENRERENAQLKADKELREAQIKFQNIIIIAIGAGLFLASILLILVLKQRKKILLVNTQLNERTQQVQTQAEALTKLNGELQHLNKNLENLVRERTEQVMLQNQRLAEFTFVNAHKLRSPVASILGLLNLFPYATNEEREEIFNHLKTSGENLDKIIRELGRDMENAIVDKE